MNITDNLIEQELDAIKSAQTYYSRIRSATRGLWAGVYSPFEFVDQMIETIQYEFPRAWEAGARRCGISPSDYNEEEKEALVKAINSEISYLVGFMQFIVENRRGRGLLSTVYERAKFWAEGFARVSNQAQVMACTDEKLMWTLNPAEHCTSCLSLSGKVKRASFWKKKDVYPKSYTKLKCRQKCRCILVPTDSPITPGPLPGLP